MRPNNLEAPTNWSNTVILKKFNNITKNINGHENDSKCRVYSPTNIHLFRNNTDSIINLSLHTNSPLSSKIIGESTTLHWKCAIRQVTCTFSMGWIIDWYAYQPQWKRYPPSVNFNIYIRSSNDTSRFISFPKGGQRIFVVAETEFHLELQF